MLKRIDVLAIDLTWETLARKSPGKQERLVFRVKALFLLKNIFCLYFSPIAKLKQKSSFRFLKVLHDLNSELKGSCLNAFSNVNNLKSLNKEPNSFKNPSNSSCIDLFLTNRSKYFQNTSTSETEISNFHKLLKMLSWQC